MIDKPAVNATDDKHAASGKAMNSASAWFALFLAILALFFTTVGIAAGYKHWQRMNVKATENAQLIAELQQQVQAVPDSTALEDFKQQVMSKAQAAATEHDHAVKEIARMQNQTRQFADSVASQVEQITFLQAKAQQQAVPATVNDWQVAEAAFLLKLANRQLHLAADFETAMTALKAADEVLARLGAVNYLPVRQQITRDLSALQAVEHVDIAGVSQRITAIMLALQPLPALSLPAEGVGQEMTSPTAPVEASPNGEVVMGNSLWADYKRKALTTLNDAVVIRRFDQPIQTALDADTRQHLYQLLRLRLENLRLLALQRDNQGFHAQLGLLEETVQQYYQDQGTELLQQLAEFKALQLQTEIPDISASLKQLESASRTVNTSNNKQGEQN